MADIGDMSELVTLEVAATTLGRSIRTIQRMVAAGTLKSELREGRTLVAIERPTGADAATARQQADDTARVAAMAAVTGERAALAYREMAEGLADTVASTRRASQRWCVTAMVGWCVASGAVVMTVGAVMSHGMTRDTLTATRDQLRTSEAARVRLETALTGMTRGDELAANDAWDDCPTP